LIDHCHACWFRLGIRPGRWTGNRTAWLSSRYNTPFHHLVKLGSCILSLNCQLFLKGHTYSPSEKSMYAYTSRAVACGALEMQYSRQKDKERIRLGTQHGHWPQKPLLDRSVCYPPTWFQGLSTDSHMHVLC
jgi:hypothetical protein